ncbi:Nmad2 family putative nucleotide modification protein [Larkinella rosea]|uniref:Nucleotide modification associated domain-containing protein n=1 Tax=Larkinella rosea TaxID=2025312 RepID=A0A3P1BCG9_9BACT|nr:hypothetical protein [Larkinella rosea]RRA98621.1 hypothetical protein EHT25_26820 [Larkinella rosea]
MAKVYMYVVDRDFGFAPNPFHGFCTLATCKPRIRNVAAPDDWVIGMGGKKLKATGRCVFAMKVTHVVTYNEYWTNPDYNDKKPIPNGSKRIMLGDNIYSQQENNQWKQAHSHHSYPDGSTNIHNLTRDTKSNKVLISKHFYYFGRAAPIVPDLLLARLGFRNAIGHRTFPLAEAREMLSWLDQEFLYQQNQLIANPFNFDKGITHYSVENNRITVIK